MYRTVLSLLLLITCFSCINRNGSSTKKELSGSISNQLKTLVKNTPDDKIPRSFDPVKGYSLVNTDDWTSGFPAGTYWYMYTLTGDSFWKGEAIKNTLKLNGIQYLTNTHDVGFMVLCSYGNAFKVTGDIAYRNVILQAAESLSKRFNPVVGCIRSWDWGDWQFPVIIDNMMNLEILFLASDETGNPKYRNIAVSHANTTLKNHFRDDMSSWHVVDYDTITGKPIKKQTHQGLNDDSAWGRGQAWGLYGFTICYRETKDPAYLKASEKIADFIIKNLPADGIPYWDFNDPAIPDAERDASAAAITASALYELSGYSAKGKQYRQVADKIIETLSSPEYRAVNGENGGFILKHCVGDKPAGAEIDVPLNYADYYYVEALKRKFDLKKGE